MKNRIGVQSYCFRDFPENAEVAKLVSGLGLDAIEVCGVHVDFQKPGSFASALAAYGKSGVGVVSTGVNQVTADLRAMDGLFGFSKAAGASVMSVDFALQNLDGSIACAESYSERYGVNLGVHNHGGRHWLGSVQALDWVFSRTTKRIGLTLDTAWALDAGEDPVAMVERYGERIHAVHLKDFTFTGNGKPEDVIVGKGNLDLRTLKAALDSVGFSGPLIIEYEGDASNPVPALKECVTIIRSVF
jgi:inosose dehydratase